MSSPKLHIRKPIIDFSKLNEIRPLSVARGNCLACAGETARLLQSNQEEKPTVVVESKFEQEILGDDYLEKGISFKVPPTPEADLNKTAIKEFLKHFQATTPGSVSFVNNEDHAYIMFKSFNNNLYLLDSDARFYKQIKTVEDFKTQPGSVNESAYNYFYDCDENKEVTVYPMRSAHPSWKNNASSIAKDIVQKEKLWFEDLPPPVPSSRLFHTSKSHEHKQEQPHVVTFHPRKPKA